MNYGQQNPNKRLMIVCDAIFALRPADVCAADPYGIGRESANRSLGSVAVASGETAPRMLLDLDRGKEMYPLSVGDGCIDST